MDVARWKADPCTFFDDGVIVDPETSRPFILYPAEKLFLRHALTLTVDGRLPYPELVFSAPKKSGKTALAAMIVLYVSSCWADLMPRDIVWRTISTRPRAACLRRQREC
jgi:hypothetical protein